MPGSPPQVRGKPAVYGGYRQMRRITPAGAGKTNSLKRIFGLYGDHPRRCGENLYFRCQQRIRRGSPPQVRGKPCILGKIRLKRRITPAGAGKTELLREQGETHWDHPRRCGENCSAMYRNVTTTGSPPQVRGKQRAAQPPSNQKRITPAGAGKTWGYRLKRQPR